MAAVNFKFGVRSKLTLLILTMALFPVGFLGWQAFNEQKQVITAEVTRSHRELSNVLAHGIYENLEYTRRLLTTISDLEIVKNLQPLEVHDFFTALVKHYPFFKLIYLVDAEKNIVASTNPDVKLPTDWRFTNAIKRSYQGSLSDVYAAPDGTPCMTLEAVIKSSEKGVTGVLVAEVDLIYIRDLLKSALQQSQSQGMVLDEAGAIIARSSEYMKTLPIMGVEVLGNDITGIRDIEGERNLITAVSLKKFDFYQAPNWTIVLQIPERQAFKAAYQLRDRVVNLLISTAVIALILAVLLADSLVSPLLKLIEGARRISRGDFDYAITPSSKDEIGELAATFDDMRVNLRQTKADLDYRITQLSTLYEVGKAISSILDFTQLQHIILETVVHVMKAEKGSLMLLDESEKALNIGVAVGLSEDIQKQTRIGIGEPVAGWIMESGQPLFVEDVESDHAFLAIKKGPIQRGTMMSVPLKAKDKILGVINVSRSTPHSFTQRDFELFLNLANQAAIAIENARLYRYAVTDEMTKLYNHRYFQQRLDEELLRADRYESKVSLIMLDVDHFKKFNDTYGHPEGDRVLKTVARLIESNVREVDIPARYGGEEFVVICPEKDAIGAMVPANRIRSAIEEFDFRIEGKRVPITVSLGVASYPDQAHTKQELIMFADTALYHSKKNGRNRASLFDFSMRSEEMLEDQQKAKESQK